LATLPPWLIVGRAVAFSSSPLSIRSPDRNPVHDGTFSTYTPSSAQGFSAMAGSSRYTRAISSEVGEIERRLRVLEKSLEKIGTRTSANARETADSLTEAIASALFGWADRFRQGASTLGDQSTAFGKNAARYGSAALTRVSEETEQRPLLAIAVALGVGILIGMAARGRP
jgi:ElaB/YqjD/DUF883 family membrane-anchored ribosome-binding protein